MQYFKSTRVYKYEAQNAAKVHILKDETHWLCGLKRKPEYEEVTWDDTLPLCLNCQVAAGMKENDRQESFKSFLVRVVNESTVDANPDVIVEALEVACKLVEQHLAQYHVVCTLEVDHHFTNETVGRIVIDANARRYFIRFTYRRNRKAKMHFESASRHYLTLPLAYVFGPEAESIGFF